MAPQAATAVIAPSRKIERFTVANGRVYAASASVLYVYSNGGRLEHRFPLPTASLHGMKLYGLSDLEMQIAADARGDVFLTESAAHGPAEVVELSPTGQQVHDVVPRLNPNGLYAWSDKGRSSVAVLAAGRDRLVSTTLTDRAHGARPRHGPVPARDVQGVNGAFVTQSAGGGFVMSTGGYVYFYDAAGHRLPSSPISVPYVGSSGASSEAPGSAIAMDASGGAVEVGSRVFVGLNAGVAQLSTVGVLEGVAPWSSLGVSLGFLRSPLDYDPASGNLYVQTAGRGGVDAIPIAEIERVITSPQVPLQHGFGDALGLGAGLSTPATANYFPAGSPPSVDAAFDSWWRYYPHPLALRYWVADGTRVTAHDLPSPTTVPLAWDKGIRGGLRFSLELTAADQIAGVYLVNADLVDEVTDKTIGSTCLTYSVGMPGDPLDFSRLPSGGSQGLVRNVALVADLGTGLYRAQLNLSTLLPRCTTSDASEATCGPIALTGWSSYDPEIEQAASLALKDGVTFEVQVGQDGAATDSLLVNKGYWGEDIQAILEHFHASAPDVRFFEVWNEPNNGWNASVYVAKILQPFFAATQAANAADGTSDQVVGGTVLGEDLGYWKEIAADGGLRDMNVAAIHAYPGYDRSFEEQGTPGYVSSLKALLAAEGVSSMPVWDTEQGWWSNGEEAFYDVGNWAPREWMWLKALGVSAWNYYYVEGNASTSSEDFSVIESSGEDEYVKPGAIGLMTVSHMLGGRPFLRQVSLQIPHAYGMLFGPSLTSPTDVLAVWTDGLVVSAQVASSATSPISITTTSSLGRPGSLSVSGASPAQVNLSGAPVYLTIPEADAGSVSVQSDESFGANLALASGGAHAKASSSQSAHGPRNVIAGTGDAALNGGWEAAQSDTSPSITVALATPRTIDRVLVATSSIASVEPGLRDYEVRVRVHGTFRAVATVKNEYFSRMRLVSFTAVPQVSAIEIVPTALDYNDQVGGLPPAKWTSSFPDYPVIYSIEVYAPGH